ncbi:serine protease, partial [Psychromonas aquatilis]
LLEHDYNIQSISACSIGALIGCVYSAGKLDDFEQWICGLSKLDVIALMDFSWAKSGLLRGDKIINSLN